MNDNGSQEVCGVDKKPTQRTWQQKYGQSMKILLPIRPPQKDKSSLPSTKSGCFSFSSLSWMSSLMWRAYRHGIKPDNLWNLAPEDTAEVNSARLSRLWDEEVAKRGSDASFPRAVWKFVRLRTFISILLAFIYSSINIIGPSWLFKEIVRFLETNDPVLAHGLAVVGIMTLTQVMRIFFFSASWTFSAHTGIRIQGAIKLFLFQKALRLRNRKDNRMSQVLNDITVETERVFEATARGTSSFTTLTVFLFIVVYSLLTIGVWSLLGVGVMLLCFPLTTFLARQSAKIRRKALPHTEKRIHLMSEVLNSIQLIKMYAWEVAFAQKVADVRNLERKILQRSAFVHTVAQTTAPIVCIVAATATFLGHTLSGNTITASQAFSVFSVFAAARLPLATTAHNTKYISDAVIGCKRMTKLLLSPEIVMPDGNCITDPSHAIVLENATFNWSDPPAVGMENLGYEPDKISVQEDPAGSLIDLTLTIQKGTLVGICGTVGSGKSSLLAALFGDMTLERGKLGVVGTMAYVPQQTWVYSGTLRDNILFGLPMEQNRYDTVLEACSLLTDIKLLPHGDLTELGERGVNLSGGQRQRINLARALYSNNDILLLDDPLSAVDTRVAKHIFERAIRSMMHHKTVLLVTHGMHFLEMCEQIIVVEGGRVVEVGTHQSLLTKGVRYAQMYNFVHTQDSEPEPQKAGRQENNEENEVEDIADDDDDDASKGRLVMPEEVSHGQVTIRTYGEYIKACGGYCVAVFVLLVFLSQLGASLFNTIWLQRWLDDGDGSKGTPFQNPPMLVDEEDDYDRLDEIRNLDQFENATEFTSSARPTTTYDPRKHSNIVDNPFMWMYALVYGISVILLVLTGIAQSFLATLVALVGSSKLHDRMFRRVLCSPMSFFDTTPVGRILNRFSKDMDELDYTFPFQLCYVLQYSLALLGQMVLIGVIYPWVITALVAILTCVIFLDVWLHAGVREMKRLENVARSSVIVYLTSAITGLSIIRIFKKEPMFIKRFQGYVNKHQAGFMLFYCTLLWFAFRMEILCSILITVTGLVVVFNPGNLTPALAGLALSSSFQVSQIITGLVRNKSDFQARFTAVERIVDYAKTLIQESAVINQKTRLPPNWPTDGSISFKEVNLRYRPGLPLILKGLNCHIKGGEKIGIIGRTGAGKSSLIGTLLRLVEVDSGSVNIDGINISSISLKELRSAISVIPQEPILFQGTIRYNLDPFNEYTDDMLWDALEKSYLKEKLKLEAMQLEATVASDGDNFSVGEKQLLCLARTILRKNKILLLDEATAFVDVETDYKIQKTIKQCFADCTILTVAHRLNTIWDSDRILVMDAGKVAEFDAPEALMNRPDSFFRAMMLAMGVTSLDNTTL